MISVSDPVAILALIIASVLFIVTDWRTALEKRLRARYGIDRDWWVPPIAFAVAVGASIVGLPAIEAAFYDKIDIIVLIFSFGIMSEGLGASGFFKYIAYKITAICNGNSTRLVLYMFTMTSIVTLFTTNDIVVLVVTPVIVEICFQAGIRNTKPILLSQFVAANTLSMGLIIGSPTNLIIAEEVGLDFVRYVILMILPAVIAFFSSFVLISWIIDLTNRDDVDLFSDLKMQSQYSLPDEVPEPYFTPQMRTWILIFGTFVVLVAIVTFLGVSLIWCAVPSMVLAMAYWYRSDEHEERLKGPITRLPYGVFFFGMTFFIFAEQFARTAFVTGQLVPMVQQFFQVSPVRAAVVGVYGSGVMVNIFNDLPAAALVASILGQVSFETFLTKYVLIQASLVGLNIGTYVTQVGALAGLIWFNQLRIQRQKQREWFPELAREMSFPKRMDLVRYGLAHFVFTGLVAGLFLLFQWVLLSVLIGPY
ncbi:SLC13 family permease [Halobellus sp. GM3]|uniref:SLC13 family permease n=1 Tax=Halobellus sp. GM3 TaxID=3458410 RepID=UPI00403DC491